MPNDIQPINVSDQMAAAISEQIPNDAVTPGVVSAVLTAYNAVQQGAPLGTACLDPTTGNWAVRYSDQGIHKWKVTAQDGGTWDDHNPTLVGWSVIHEGQA